MDGNKRKVKKSIGKYLYGFQRLYKRRKVTDTKSHNPWHDICVIFQIFQIYELFGSVWFCIFAKG